MKAILNNPYRILGILVGASAKEQTRQLSRLRQYIAAGQEFEDDYSFPVLGDLQRTENDVEEAASKLNLDADKMSAALFWFWNADPITDEVTFSALKDNNKLLPMDIWTKRTYMKDVTETNMSAFQNFSNLLLLAKDYEHGIKLKLKLFESDFVYKFITRATDKTYKCTKTELQLSFFNVLFNEIGMKELMPLISDIDFSAKQDFIKDISQKLTHRISDNIDRTKKKRKNNITDAAQIGRILFKDIESDLEQLKLITGEQEFTYSNIADKVANEILQCGIDYLSYYKYPDMGMINASMDLYEKAKMIAVGNITKKRIEENICELQNLKKKKSEERAETEKTTQKKNEEERLMNEGKVHAREEGQEQHQREINEKQKKERRTKIACICIIFIFILLTIIYFSQGITVTLISGFLICMITLFVLNYLTNKK